VKALTYPRRGLHGEVVHTIGLQIVSGELQPNDPLPPEDELTSDLAVSRTVLREAVRVLAAKGLVGARPKTGTRVRPRAEWNILDPDVLSWRVEASNDSTLYQETTEIRLAIEPLAARLAATRALDEEIAAIAEAYSAMEAGVKDQFAYLAADLNSHDRILSACHNELLGHLGGILRGVLRATFELTTTPPRSRRRALPLHKAILDGIAERDEDRAEEAARVLIADTAADIKRLAGRDGRRRTRSRPRSH
jgi:GntR family transcriptional regulator, galactonate operon transcriptional repressor